MQAQSLPSWARWQLFLSSHILQNYSSSKKKRITAPPLYTQSYCPSLLLAFIANIHAMYFTYLPFIVYLSLLKLLQKKQKRVDSLWHIPAKHVCKS